MNVRGICFLTFFLYCVLGVPFSSASDDLDLFYGKWKQDDKTFSFFTDGTMEVAKGSQVIKGTYELNRGSVRMTLKSKKGTSNRLFKYDISRNHMTLSPKKGEDLALTRIAKFENKSKFEDNDDEVAELQPFVLDDEATSETSDRAWNTNVHSFIRVCSYILHVCFNDPVYSEITAEHFKDVVSSVRNSELLSQEMKVIGFDIHEVFPISRTNQVIKFKDARGFDWNYDIDLDYDASGHFSISFDSGKETNLKDANPHYLYYFHETLDSISLNISLYFMDNEASNSLTFEEFEAYLKEEGAWQYLNSSCRSMGIFMVNIFPIVRKDRELTILDAIGLEWIWDLQKHEEITHNADFLDEWEY